WVLVADIEDASGQRRLDGTLRLVVEHELAASPLVRIVPRARVDETLRLMRRDASTPLDAAIAREVAQRDPAIRAVVAGRLERSGQAADPSMTEYERLFVRGSYHSLLDARWWAEADRQGMDVDAALQHAEEAVVADRALMRLRPDDYWAAYKMRMDSEYLHRH